MKKFFKNISRTIKLTWLFLFVPVSFTFAADTYAQNTLITINLSNRTVADVLETIGNETEFNFYCNSKQVDTRRIVSVNVKDKHVYDILEQLFNGQDVAYKIVDKDIILTPAAKAGVNGTNGVTQNRVAVSGTVTDISGEPVSGANVVEKGTKNGTITNADGMFSFNVTPGATLEISYVGYLNKEVAIGSNTLFSIQMEEDRKTLEEVVVVGYGTQKKVNLTGSVEAVKGEELIKRPVMSTMLALQGLASGVTITSTSGQPGKEGESVRIRGIGTLNNNDPLVLVDGVAGSINAVSPYDIENISILKDAASSSIYGSRAANGVILITTKRAKGNRFSINFSGSLGLQQVVDEPKFLGAIDYMELYDLANANDTRNTTTGAPGGVKFGKEYIDEYRKGMLTDKYTYPNTNWADITYRSPAFQQQYNLSLSGGTEKLRTFSSFNVQEQNGIFPDTYLKRYSLRVNSDYQFSDKFSMGVDFSGRHSIVSEPNGASFQMGEVRRTAPIYMPQTPTGLPGYVPLGSNTWAASQEKYIGYNRDWYQEGLVNIKATYSPVKSLRFDAAYAPKFNFQTNKGYGKTLFLYDKDDVLKNANPTPQNSSTMTKAYTLNSDIKLLANFNETFGSHTISVLAGFQQITNYWENLTAHREKSEFDYDQLAAMPPLNQTGNGNADEWALQSNFGRLNYDFAGKYLLEANVRYDGSSRFSKGYRWGLFPSFSAGWRFSQETFMKNIDWLSNGKLRLSWGQLGNQEGLGNYPTAMNINIDRPVVFNRQVAYGYAAIDYAMIDLSWETTEMTNIGIDLGLLNNKLEINFDYYEKVTSNILMPMDIPLVMGYGNQPNQNAGKVENKGWDLTLSHNNRFGDWSYRVTATLSDVKNKILDMKGIVKNFDAIKTNRVGYPINSLWGLESAGLFSSFEEAKTYSVTQFGYLQGGDIRYIDQLTVDTNGDGIPDAGDGRINNEDYRVIGNTIPRYTYSLDVSVQYKDFDLGVFFQGVGKRDSYLRDDLGWAFNNAGNVQQWQKDGMWKEGQTNASYPRMFISSTNNIQPSTYWLQNAAYLRLKNLQFGYSIPQKALKKTFIQGARFYISGQNVFTFKHMTEGFDPEQKPDYARDAMPFTKTYAFGFNLNF